MSSTPQVRLSKIIRDANHEMAINAVVSFGVGVVSTFIVFGSLFGIVWLATFSTPIALGVMSALLVVATWSAWRRVDPTHGLEALSEEDMLMTEISGAMGGSGRQRRILPNRRIDGS